MWIERFRGDIISREMAVSVNRLTTFTLLSTDVPPLVVNSSSSCVRSSSSARSFQHRSGVRVLLSLMSSRLLLSLFLAVLGLSCGTRDL